MKNYNITLPVTSQTKLHCQEFLRWNPQPSAEYRAFSWTLTYMPAKNYWTSLIFVMLIRQTGCRGFLADFPRPSTAALRLLYPPTCFWCTDFHGLILSQRFVWKIKQMWVPRYAALMEDARGVLPAWCLWAKGSFRGEGWILSHLVPHPSGTVQMALNVCPGVNLSFRATTS